MLFHSASKVSTPDCTINQNRQLQLFFQFNSIQRTNIVKHSFLKAKNKQTLWVGVEVWVGRIEC